MRYRPAIQEGDRAEKLLVQAHAMKRAPSLIESLKSSPSLLLLLLRSSKHKSGVILSPTYPGTYPNILNCNYKFIGQANERVSIHFEEILLHFGADQ